METDSRARMRCGHPMNYLVIEGDLRDETVVEYCEACQLADMGVPLRPEDRSPSEREQR